jgi:uncharacterized Zn-finger protein
LVILLRIQVETSQRMSSREKRLCCKTAECCRFAQSIDNDFLCLLFQCTVCRRKFTTLYNLNSHKKLHDRPNIYSCSIEQCSSEFQTQRELDNHLKVKQTKNIASVRPPQSFFQYRSNIEKLKHRMLVITVIAENDSIL